MHVCQPITLNNLIRFQWSAVGFYDNGVTEIVADKISLANGITLSTDKQFVLA